MSPSSLVGFLRVFEWKNRVQHSMWDCIHTPQTGWARQQLAFLNLDRCNRPMSRCVMRQMNENLLEFLRELSFCRNRLWCGIDKVGESSQFTHRTNARWQCAVDWECARVKCMWMCWNETSEQTNYNLTNGTMCAWPEYAPCGIAIGEYCNAKSERTSEQALLDSSTPANACAPSICMRL